MIPMRLYTAESNTVDGETTTETSVLPAYPIRVYYTVGMKANLVDASGNLDASQIDSNYIATVYNVTVTVTDDLQGHLVATVTGEGGNELNMTFNNKYTKPAEPQNPDDDGTPKAVQTGDTTPIIPTVIAVLVSLAAIAAVVVIIMRRRRR